MKKLQLDLAEFQTMALPYDKEVIIYFNLTFCSETKKPKVRSFVKWLSDLDGQIQDYLTRYC